MSAYRASSIDTRAFNIANKYGYGIEWSIKVNAAYNNGAIYIPFNGYYWCQHNSQSHRKLSSVNRTKDTIMAYKAEMGAWATRIGPIPNADLTLV